MNNSQQEDIHSMVVRNPMRSLALHGMALIGRLGCRIRFVSHSPYLPVAASPLPLSLPQLESYLLLR